MLKSRAIGAQKHKLEKEKFALQKDSLWFDFFKHMTTLNTGVVLIVATLFEKSLLVPKNPLLTNVSYFLFCISLIGCLFGMATVLPSRSEHPKEPKGFMKKLDLLRERMVGLTAILFTLGGFIFGLFITIINTTL